MKHLFKRTFCLILALVLCFGMLPVVASAEEESATLSFAKKDQRTVFTTSQQVWVQNGITLTNNKSSSTSSIADYAGPARFYAKSELIIEAPGNITKIVFDCNSSSYATAMKNSIGTTATTSVSSDKVTVTLNGTTNTFTVASLTAQVRMDSLTVTYAKSGACQHANTTTTTVDATCTTAGSVTVTCDDCGEVVNEETIAAGHSYTSVVTPPTATEQGYTTYTCGACGDSYVGDYTEALGETYTVSFSVPEGVTAPADMGCNKTGITLPTVDAPEGYTFVGWTDGAVEDTETAPTVYTGSFVATTNTTLYALYTYTVGGGAGGYVLTDITAISETDEVVITMTYGSTVYALPNNGGAKTPAAEVITITDGVLNCDDESVLLWNISANNGSYTFYPNGTTAKWLYCTGSNSGVRIGTDSNKVFTTDASGYLKHTATGRYLGVYRINPDWRCYTNTTGNTANQTLGLYVKSAGGTTYYTTLSTAAACAHEHTTDITVAATCTVAGSVSTVCDDCGMTVDVVTIPATGHQNTTTTVDATCTEAGSRTVTCDACGATVSTEEIAPLGHTIVDGACTECDYEVVDYSGDYYIATKRTEGNYFYMTGNLGTATTKRYTAVDSGLAELPASVTGGEATKTFTLILQDDGTYIIKNGENYLGWSSGNAGILVEEEDALKLTVEVNKEGLFNIHFTGDEERYLSLNGTTGNDYFAFYKGTQKQDLSLIPVAECTHEDTTTTTVDATCTEGGSKTVTCACGEVISTEVIPATGHTYEDGVCGCGEKANVQVGENWCTTVQEAVDAAPAGGYVKLLDYSTETVHVEKDLYLDLNGFDLDKVIVAAGATLYGVDSTTDDYDCSNGYGTIAAVTGNVATQYKAVVDGKIRRYVTCTEDGAVSFHRIYVGVTSVSLRPGASGMGYKATIAGDEKVLEMIEGQVSMTMWVKGYENNAVTKSATMTENRVTLSALVKGMDVDAHYDMFVCANVSVTVNDEQITSTTAQCTLKQAIEAVADAIAGGAAYTDSQMSALQDLCGAYGELMASWSNIGSILNWTPSA